MGDAANAYTHGFSNRKTALFLILGLSENSYPITLKT
jgi:hypothetical protein